MATFTPQQRIDLLTRLILKAHAGQIDANKLVSDLVTALGTNFDAQLKTEAQAFLADLNQRLPLAQADVVNVQNQITAITPATV